MPADGSPRSANRAGAVASVNAAGSQSATSSHSRGIDTRASGAGRTDQAGPVLGVLVVVEEDPMAFLLPPFAAREVGRAPFHLTREGQRRASHLLETPAPLDTHVDVHTARA